MERVEQEAARLTAELTVETARQEEEKKEVVNAYQRLERIVVLHLQSFRRAIDGAKLDSSNCVWITKIALEYKQALHRIASSQEFVYSVGIYFSENLLSPCMKELQYCICFYSFNSTLYFTTKGFLFQ